MTAHRPGKRAGNTFGEFFIWLLEAIRNPIRVRSVSRRTTLRELKKLHHRVANLYTASPIQQSDTNEFVAKLVVDACDDAERKPSMALLRPFFDATFDLMLAEGLWRPPEVDWSIPLTLEDEVDLRRYLRGQERLFSRYDFLIDIWLNKLFYTFSGILDYLPDTLSPEDAEDEAETLGFEVPLINLLEDPAEAIERLLATFADDDVVRNTLFTTMRERMERNILIASGIDPEGRYGTNRTPVPPTKARDMSPHDLIDQYLGGTPFAELFLYPYPFSIPRETRFEHCHIVGGTGHGKTQLIQSLIYDDLYPGKAERPGLCVIDSQGELISKLSRLGVFDTENVEGLSDKLILIDPTDIEFPVCLNLFDFHLERVGSLPALERETILNGTVDLFEYMFGALLGAELTQRQGVIFKYLARLMMVIPGSTIQTLRALMEDGEQFRPYVERLEGTTRAFFETQFYSSSFAATKKQILTRLWGVLSNTTLERMFSHESNKIDLFDAMNSGKIVLINTAKDLLKRDGCQILGRFFIAMLGHAVLERASMPREKRRPFFVYIDEAHEYFDERVEELLNQSRKYRVGLTLAHQTLDQLTLKLKATFMANTSIKYAGGVSSKDAVDFAREMHCMPGQIQRTKKKITSTEFSCFVKNVTGHAVNIVVPLGLIERQRVLTDGQYKKLMELNREKYAAPAAAQKTDMLQATPQAEPERRPKPQSPSRKKVVKQATASPQADSPLVVTRTEPAVSESFVPPSIPTVGRGGPQHTYLQKLIKRLAEEHGFRATIEEQVLGGTGSVDVSLVKGERRIACEISITTTPEHELGNIQKCLAAGYDPVFVLAQDQKHRRKLEQYAHQHLEEGLFAKINFCMPEDFVVYLDQDDTADAGTTDTVRGYTVKVKYSAIEEVERKSRRDAIAKVILKSMRRID